MKLDNVGNKVISIMNNGTNTKFDNGLSRVIQLDVNIYPLIGVEPRLLSSQEI